MVLFHKEVKDRWKIKEKDVIYKGSTSIIVEDKHPNFIVGFTNDPARIKWFQENRSRLKYRLLDSQYIGNKHEGLETVYVYRMHKLYAVSEASKAYIKENIIDQFNSIKGGEFFKFFTLIRKTKSMKLRDLFIRLKKVLSENNTYKLRLSFTDFLEDKNGNIFYISPFSSKD